VRAVQIAALDKTAVETVASVAVVEIVIAVVVETAVVVEEQDAEAVVNKQFVEQHLKYCNNVTT
jgi:hypothetical protein